MNYHTKTQKLKFDPDDFENFSNRLKSNVVLLMLDKYCSPAIFKF